MIKALLEKEIGQSISDADFAVIMQMTGDDIRFNRIGFNKRTNLKEFLSIATTSEAVFKKSA